MRRKMMSLSKCSGGTGSIPPSGTEAEKAEGQQRRMKRRIPFLAWRLGK
jgi:hypothetical protein